MSNQNPDEDFVEPEPIPNGYGTADHPTDEDQDYDDN